MTCWEEIRRSHLHKSPNPNGSTRGGVNTTPQGGSLPRRSQRPGRKNSNLSQRPCVFHDPGYDVKLHPAVILYMSLGI